MANPKLHSKDVYSSNLQILLGFNNHSILPTGEHLLPKGSKPLDGGHKIFSRGEPILPQGRKATSHSFLKELMAEGETNIQLDEEDEAELQSLEKQAAHEHSEAILAAEAIRTKKIVEAQVEAIHAYQKKLAAAKKAASDTEENKSNLESSSTAKPQGEPGPHVPYLAPILPTTPSFVPLPLPQLTPPHTFSLNISPAPIFTPYTLRPRQ